MTVGNPQTYPKAGDISALNGGVLRRILIMLRDRRMLGARQVELVPRAPDSRQSLLG